MLRRAHAAVISLYNIDFFINTGSTNIVGHTEGKKVQGTYERI